MQNGSGHCRPQQRDLAQQRAQRGPYLLRRDGGIGAGGGSFALEIGPGFFVGRGQSPSPSRSDNASWAKGFSAQGGLYRNSAAPSLRAQAKQSNRGARGLRRHHFVADDE